MIIQAHGRLLPNGIGTHTNNSTSNQNNILSDTAPILEPDVPSILSDEEDGKSKDHVSLGEKMRVQKIN
ncbi:MAG: hypothetical protein OEU36_13270 [Gammaproteobacteria bacterium]|nr:hypothetical protein [Gammaproteobacteria bacterium]